MKVVAQLSALLTEPNALFVLFEGTLGDQQGLNLRVSIVLRAKICTIGQSRHRGERMDCLPDPSDLCERALLAMPALHRDWSREALIKTRKCG